MIQSHEPSRMQANVAAKEHRPLATAAKRLLASEYLVLGMCIVYFAVLAPLADGFASVGNARNILAAMLPLLIVAIGQTYVLISGGIDLSVTSTIALSSVVGAFTMAHTGPVAAAAGVGAMLLLGLLIGIFNGVLVAHAKMPPFILTLTVTMFVSGLAIWLTKSKNITGLPPAFTGIGRNFWLAFAVTVVIAWLAQVFLARSLFGRWLYAVGHNARAASISGVPTHAVITAAYVVSGACASAASILMTGRLETGSPVLGQRILLDVIGATVVGGTSLFGGKGKVVWTIFGVLFITLIDNSLNLLGLSQFAIMMVKGGVILLAALLDSLRNKLVLSS